MSFCVLWTAIVSVLLAFAGKIGGSQKQAGNDVVEAEKPLRVLLISSYFVGHQFPLIAVGEELVGRGHNVTLFTTEVKGSNVIPQVPERVGIKFLSAGPEHFTKEEFEAKYSNLGEKGLLESLKIMINMTAEHHLRMRQGVDRLDCSDWDIVLTDQAVINVIPYISLKWSDTPVVVQYSTALVDTSGQTPIYGDYLDNMTFFQRFMNAVVHTNVMRFGLWVSWRSILNNDAILGDVLQDEPNPIAMLANGNPIISTTTIGFEFPRAFLPMVHLSGPQLIKASPPIGEELEQWLSEKREKKVVYISMGSTAFLTKKMGEGLVEGITAAGYDAVWSLRESNRDILKGNELDRERFYVSNWVSQQAVLQHKAIGVAILHGGMNGVHEAIYYKVPVIVVPFGMDQPLVASRIHYQQLGIRLFSEEVTAEQVASSIQAVESGDYRDNVEKLSKIFRFAGGTKKAADIVEHYADVGYDHLYPAFYKYKWNWVQYYNLDVYALLIGILAVVAYGFYRIMKFTCNKCFVLKSKTD